MVGMTLTVIAVGVILYVECGVGCGPLRLVCVSSYKLFTQVGLCVSLVCEMSARLGVL